MAAEPRDTSWTVLRAAADGDAGARSSFSRSYEATIRDFFDARWRGRILHGEVEDATQEVLIECLEPDGVLARADPTRGDFRGLLFGVARNVALRCEERAQRRGRIRPEDNAWLQQIASDDAGQATLFDRGWARSLMRQAKQLHQARSLLDGEAGRRRIELLERRFGEDEPIRDIAAAWGVPAQDVHNAYRKARKEFYRCLEEVVAAHAPDGADLEAECRRLLALLG